MARFNEKAAIQPWPDHHVCDDGKTRSLSVYIAEEWLDHPDVSRPWPGYLPGDGRGGELVFTSHRIRAARSLGRDPLELVAQMSGRRGPRRKSPFR